MAVPVEFVSCAAASAARPKVATRAKKRILIVGFYKIEMGSRRIGEREGIEYRG